MTSGWRLAEGIFCWADLKETEAGMKQIRNPLRIPTNAFHQMLIGMFRHLSATSVHSDGWNFVTGEQRLLHRRTHFWSAKIVHWKQNMKQHFLRVSRAICCPGHNNWRKQRVMYTIYTRGSYGRCGNRGFNSRSVCWQMKSAIVSIEPRCIYQYLTLSALRLLLFDYCQ